MKKDQLSFTSLREARESFQTAEANHAEAQRGADAAEEAVIHSTRDDGSLEPEQLLEQRDKAQRLRDVRSIELNRAEGKLAEARQIFHGLVDENAGPIEQALRDRAEELTKDLTEKAAQAVGPEATKSAGFLQQLRKNEGLQRLNGSANRISMSKVYRGHDRSEPPADLIANVFEGLELL